MEKELLARLETLEKTMNEQVKTKDNEISKLKKRLTVQEDLLNKVHTYLDNIDDDLDYHDNIINTFCRENEMVADTINMIYEQLKTATVSSIKDKSFETVFIFYLLHSLVDNNIIMLDKFVETINEHLENIKNIYNEENVELNFDKELEVLNNILEDSKTPIEKKIKESRKNKDKKKNQSKDNQSKDNQSKDNQSKDSNIIDLSNFRKK